ncbi:MAG: ABC transporter ATP-binding protein [Chloracidobacterium sp.]|nr:ABC transporter ATP-binding protein [Chloracidobacterium sp.]MDW8216032.1 ABC transporter ATP-binding protein [Acidobacteriota bacterium]
MAFLELDKAWFEVGGAAIAREVSLAPPPGRFLALIGPNGSGKTTVLRLLAGLLAPTRGAARLEGRDLRRWSRRDIARRIAVVPQDTHLEFAFTVRDIVAMGRHAHLGRFQPEGAHDRAVIEQAMMRADVLHLRARLVTELSGGERQRVLIARSLATEAPAILLDEPTASLDVAHALETYELCRALADEGKTIVMAVHDLNAAARYADQVAVMQSGRCVARGAPSDVLHERLLAEVFGVEVEVFHSRGGWPTFVFHRSGVAVDRVVR